MAFKASTIVLLTLLLPTIGLAIQARSLPPDFLRARAQSQVTRSLASELKFTKQTIEFSVPSGKVLTATLLVPSTGKKDERFPVLSIFGGFQRAAKVLELIQPNVPVIVASFDYPFEAPRKFEFPKSLKYAPDAKRAIADMLDAIDEMHAVLRQRTDVDPVKITVVGASFGAPFALAAAANDPTLSGVVIVHGFGDIPGTVKHQLVRKWEPKFGVLAHPMAWLLSNIGWIYLDGPTPEDSALRLTSRQRVFMIQAEEDSFIPSASSNRLWKAIEESAAQRDRLVTPGDHLQPGSEQLIEKISEHVVTWMKRTELL